MITILLACYNGEKYIKEQLDSLFSQSVQDFKIRIFDDASTDNTISIIQGYERKYPGRVFYTRNRVNTGSPKEPFFNLMQDCESDYYMLCDQDDVWKPNKIELSLNKIKELETLHGFDVPFLVFSDLTVTDENLNVTARSFKEVMMSDYTRTRFNTLIVQNILTGCTAMYNKALAKLIRKPPYCVMHDWWLILIAAAFGKIGVIDTQTLFYRQHGKNIVGAKRVTSFRYKLKKLAHNNEIKAALKESYEQAENFLHTYADMLSAKQTQILSAYAGVPRLSKMGRWRVITKYGIYKAGFGRVIAQYIFI